MHRFVPNHAYRRPAPLHVPAGEPATISASTIHVARDANGREVGYLIEEDIGAQASPGARPTKELAA